jgi:hypothetical protein
MSNKESTSLSKDSYTWRSLLLWPGVVIVLLQWLVRFALPAISPEASSAGVLGGLVGGLALFIWWMFFSRAHKYERWGAVLIMTGLLILSANLVGEPAFTGVQGLMFFIYSVPALSLAFVVWAFVSARLPDRIRCLLMIISIVMTCGVWTHLRHDWIAGNTGEYFCLRWSETPYELWSTSPGDNSFSSQDGCFPADRINLIN